MIVPVHRLDDDGLREALRELSLCKREPSTLKNEPASWDSLRACNMSTEAITRPARSGCAAIPESSRATVTPAPVRSET